MTLGQAIQIGSFTFTVLRILVGAGLVRVIIRREHLGGGVNRLDQLMLLSAVWALVSSYFHSDPSAALIFRLGFVYNTCGVYFILRVLCQSLDDTWLLFRLTALLLVPVAVAMLMEQMTVRNFFSALGGVPEFPAIRDGRVRAQGPFAHAILAGTVGGVCLPMMIGLWRHHRKHSVMGIVACCTMVVTSASSGPIMSAVAGIGALFAWRIRHRMRLLRWLAVLGYIVLDIVMLAPPYYLIYRIDLTGSSAGFHRAALIESSIQHLNEWWLGGTDYTRHWMVTGVTWSADHTDITNYYLHLGVIGGLPLMLLFIAMLTKGFSFIGDTQRPTVELSPSSRFKAWALGASLFAHAATAISVSYFDQSFLFLYLTLAVIGSARSESYQSARKRTYWHGE